MGVGDASADCVIPGVSSGTLPTGCHSRWWRGLGSGQSALLRPYLLILSTLKPLPGSTTFQEPFTLGGHTGPRHPPDGKHLTLGSQIP